MKIGEVVPSWKDGYLRLREAKELSKRLMGDSYKETLTNIVEWQEKISNIGMKGQRCSFCFMFSQSYLFALFRFPVRYFY